jgi:ribosomal protein S18 acetylase RimI-like enzyme
MPGMLDKEVIRTVQERANNIWPAEFSYFLNGWIIRFSKGVTWRANSVLPLNYWGENISEDIKKVEEIYKQFNSSSKFMLHDHHDPSELHSLLIKAAYKSVMPTDVMGKLLMDIDIQNNDNGYKYHFMVNRDPEWYSALTRLSPNRSPYKMTIIGEIIDRVHIPQKSFFYALNKSDIIGVALAIIDNGYMGIMNLTVDPEYRNQGVATNLIRQTIKWGKNYNTKWLFLQVEKSNTSARKLYEKIGLDDWYSYTYYEKG